MLLKYGFEGLEKIDNEPKYIEEAEEKEEVMSSTSKTTGTMYLTKILNEKKSHSSWLVIEYIYWQNS